MSDYKNSAGVKFNDETDLIIRADPDGTVESCFNRANNREYIGGSGLPEVSNEDEGMILSVVNGEWVKTVPIWGYQRPMFILSVDVDAGSGTVLSTSMTAAEIDNLMSNPPSNFHSTRAMVILNFMYQEGDDWIIDYSLNMPVIVSYTGTSSNYTYYLESDPMPIVKTEGNITTTQFVITLNSNGTNTLSMAAYILSATPVE